MDRVYFFFLHSICNEKCVFVFFSDPKDPSPITPIQGPIFIKNSSVPVVPLFSYPTMNNGTFIRIPVSILTKFFLVRFQIAKHEQEKTSLQFFSSLYVCAYVPYS